MINCDVFGIGQLCSGLRLQTYQVKQWSFGRSEWEAHTGQTLTKENRKQMRALLMLASGVAKQFEWEAVQNRVLRFERQVDDPKFNMVEWHHELKALMDAVEDGLSGQLIYRYPAEEARVLSKWKDDWNAVLTGFPQAGEDIFATVDLWAMGHSTASVFHAMRVLEHGLHALSAEVGCNFTIQNWFNIINEIEAAIKKEEKSLKKGVERNRRLQFLSEAAKEFAYFKDGWRNYVSHNKCKYDEHQARSAMEHVRAFMSSLAANLSPSALAVSEQQPSQTAENPHLHQAPERPQ